MPKTKTTSKAQGGRVTLGSPVQVISQKRKSAAKAKPGHGKRRTPKQTHIESRPLLEPHAAGIDMGAREMYVAVPPDRDAHPVRVFHTFSADLNELADWLVACGVTTVAMESTGVYWTPIAEILEARGIRPCVVDARHMKNVPDGAQTGTNVSGFSFCTPWDYCVRRSGGRRQVFGARQK